MTSLRPQTIDNRQQHFYSLSSVICLLSSVFCLLSLGCTSKSRVEEAEININVGIKYYEDRDYEKAIFHIEKGLDVLPKDEKALIYVGKAYAEIRDFNKSVATWQKYMFVNIPGSPEAIEGQKELDNASKQLNAQRRWTKIKDAKDIALFVEFCKKHPKSVYVVQAQERIRILKNE